MPPVSPGSDDYRQYIESRLAGLEQQLNDRFSGMEKATTAALVAAKEAVAAALEAAQKAVQKAEIAADKRFDSVNEFRGTLSDQASKLMPRLEADARLLAIEMRMQELNSRIDRSEGRGSGLSSGWGYLIGGIGLLGSILAIFLALSK